MALFLLIEGMNLLTVRSKTLSESKQTPVNGKNAIGTAEMRELNQEFSREGVLELVQMFRGEGSLLLERMGAAVERQDGEALGRAAHALRGAGMNFGAQFLNELCQEIESRARARDCLRATTLILQVREEWGRVLTALQTECCAA